MKRWWKHTDLCVIAALIVGIFAFRHGEETLAAVTPRLTAIRNAVIVKLDKLTAKLTVDPGDAAPSAITSADGVGSAQEGLPPVPPPADSPLSPPPAAGSSPPGPFVPHARTGCIHVYTW